MSNRGFSFGFGPGEFWWGARGGGGGGRHRWRRGSWFESGDMKYVILKLLKEKPMHGYEVMKALEEQTRGCYKPSPGTVYPTLQWLEDEGLVRGEEQDGKKVYSITDQGVAFLETNKSTVEDIFDRVDQTIDSLLSDPVPEVTRLVGRLVSQSYRAAWRLRDSEEKWKQLREVLERALKEVEALAN
jgi:DNA-binding PadR family transcriptional regulator